MWQILCSMLMLVAWVCASIGPHVGYHREFGIPTAKKIKEYEDRIFAEENDSLTSRIIGGSPTPRNAYPFFAGLLIDVLDERYESVCGASLLSVNRLVTAAHCWFDGEHQAWQFTVVLGSQYLYEGGTRITTTYVIRHPQHDTSRTLNDIAIIYLPVYLIFNEAISPIDLPHGPELGSSYAGEWAIAIGFGRTNDEQEKAQSYLSHVKLQVITVDECRKAFPQFGPPQICTSTVGHVGTCHGDSGGPLATFLNGRPVLIGVTSFSSLFGCTYKDMPSGFTRVTSYYDFITYHLQQ